MRAPKKQIQFLDLVPPGGGSASGRDFWENTHGHAVEEDCLAAPQVYAMAHEAIQCLPARGWGQTVDAS